MREATRRAFLNTIGRLGGLTLVGAASPAILAAEALPATLPDVVRPAGIGSTRTLEILPLVEWATARPDLVGEAGVSYLVRTDGSTILFDVGGNLRSTDPSPLEANMQRLGLRLEEIDTIVISHLHMDHVGGLQFSSRGTFSLGLRQIDLGTRRVVVPVPMNYPGLEPVVARRPTILAPGVVTLGPITGRIAMGPVDEQALAIRVQDRGVVLIVGCGHPGLDKLLARTAQLFDEPLYGVIGGLHYPVPRGRIVSGGQDLQRWATYGNGPGPSAEDVQREIDALAARRPQWVALSPHDSSDEMIDAFRRVKPVRRSSRCPGPRRCTSCTARSGPPPWCSWLTAVVTRRAPLAPSGWPSAMAPPLGLTRGSSSASPGRAARPGPGRRRPRSARSRPSAPASGRSAPAPCAWPAPGRCP
jgi:7,8-dihydropterin-6-yl-methyl-4-(beta-D-ribofuranosyl)aminobenzene 5'-phosphate synthase